MKATALRLAFPLIAFTSLAAATARADGIPFGIDCMVHDAAGTLLKDLGTVGTDMSGATHASNSAAYGDLTITASLAGPFVQAPEVKAPQLQLTVQKNGVTTAGAIVSATPDLNLALLEPTEQVYVHCEKMGM